MLLLETLNNLATQPIVMFLLGLVGVYFVQFVKEVAKHHADNSRHWDIAGGAADALLWLKRRLLPILVCTALLAGVVWYIFDPCVKARDQLSAEEFQKCDVRKLSLPFS